LPNLAKCPYGLPIEQHHEIERKDVNGNRSFWEMLYLYALESWFKKSLSWEEWLQCSFGGMPRGDICFWAA
jgi:hypothetical protein